MERSKEGDRGAAVFWLLFRSIFATGKAPVQKVTGVVGIVGTGSRPEPIPEQEIDALRRLIASVLPYDPHPYLHEGMKVEVVRGPLEGRSWNSAAERKATSACDRSAPYTTSCSG
jgi:hypothetical protein